MPIKMVSQTRHHFLFYLFIDCVIRSRMLE
jgi:hypothetical protein